jgi:hypothetical protein
MATRSTQVKVVPQQPQEDEQKTESWLTEETFTADALNDALQSVFAEMGVTGEGEASVFVSKVDGIVKGEDAKVWEGDAGDYDLMAIARQHGSGKYRVRVYVKPPVGAKQIKANKVFGVLLTPEEERQRTKGPETTDYLKKSDLETILATALARIQPVQPATNPADTVTLAIQLAKAMQPAQPAVDMLGMMTMAMQFAEKMRPDPDATPRDAGANGNDVIVAMIDKFGPAFASVMEQTMRQQAQQQAAAQPAQIQQLPATIPEPQPNIVQSNETTINEDDAMREGKRQFAMGIQFLVAQAQAGNPVETYAEMIMDNVPEETLMALLKAPDPIAMLSEVNQEVAKYQEWFVGLLDEVKKMVSDATNSNSPTD